VKVVFRLQLKLADTFASEFGIGRDGLEGVAA